MQSDDYDNLIQVIYAGACDDAAFQQALRMLAAVHDCASAALVYTDGFLPVADIAVTYGPFSDPEIRARYQLYAADDPAPHAMAQLAVGQAAATNRLFTPGFLATSRFLKEFYRPLGFEEALGGPVVNTRNRIGIVAIHRGPDRQPFGDREIAGFGRLLPHFGQALALRRTFFAVCERNDALGAALETTTQGVLLVDPEAVVKHANARARTMLKRGDGLSLSRDGRLRLRDGEVERCLLNRLAPSRSAELPVVLRVRRPDGSQPYLLRVMRRDAAAGDRPVSLATISISDPEALVGTDDKTLGEVLGVSRQAAALVATLLRGGDLAGHAAQAGITRNTAKFHLQTAFTATGTNRQSDLVRVVTGLLRDLGRDPGAD